MFEVAPPAQLVFGLDVPSGLVDSLGHTTVVTADTSRHGLARYGEWTRQMFPLELDRYCELLRHNIPVGDLGCNAGAAFKVLDALAHMTSLTAPFSGGPGWQVGKPPPRGAGPSTQRLWSLFPDHYQWPAMPETSGVCVPPPPLWPVWVQRCTNSLVRCARVWRQLNMAVH
jgi:hypothetical protein